MEVKEESACPAPSVFCFFLFKQSFFATRIAKETRTYSKGILRRICDFVRRERAVEVE